MTIGQWVMIALLALAAALLAFNYRKVQSAWLAAKRFFREVRVEMQKVSWPSRPDLIASTTVVIVAIVSLTVIIMAWDSILALLLSLILPGEGS
jgi:preprotein translocase subunit SecE